jgi:hypothetical protein
MSAGAWTGLAIIVVAALAMVATMATMRYQSQKQRRFGSDYERMVEEHRRRIGWQELPASRSNQRGI